MASKKGRLCRRLNAGSEVLGSPGTLRKALLAIGVLRRVPIVLRFRLVRLRCQAQRILARKAYFLDGARHIGALRRRRSLVVARWW